MHFALPPRKSAHPPPFTRAAHLNNASQRRRQLQYASYVVLGILSLYLLYNAFLTSATPTSAPTEIDPRSTVCIVTVFDQTSMSAKAIQQVKHNREDYAARHGYTNFFTNTTAYDSIISPSPSTWALVPALRHALTLHPTTTYFWALSASALITSPSLSLHTHIFNNLTTLMQKDIPVVPPDSVIRTFSHLHSADVHLILTQDLDNLAQTSLILLNQPTNPTTHKPDNWALFFLDAWLDPLYRTYAFQKAEQHALEHIVQWHSTVLAKLALVPQRVMNSYNFKSEGKEGRNHDSLWQEGDFVVNLKGCKDMPGRNCEKEMDKFYEGWKEEVRRLDGKKE